MTTRPLGWHAPEARGRAPHVGVVLATLAALATLPRTVLLAGLPPIYDQGRVGSCTAQALAAAVAILLHRLGLLVVLIDRAALYYRERAALGTVGEDSGAILADGVAALRRGFEAERAASLAWGPAWTQAPPAPPADAPRVVSAEPLAIDVPTVCWELACGHPVVVGLSITAAWDELVGDALPLPSGPSIGGHAVALVGYDLGRRAFRVRNSWGEDWGDAGYAWLPFEWVEVPWCGEAHALRAVREALNAGGAS